VWPNPNTDARRFQRAAIAIEITTHIAVPTIPPHLVNGTIVTAITLRWTTPDHIGTCGRPVAFRKVPAVLPIARITEKIARIYKAGSIASHSRPKTSVTTGAPTPINRTAYTLLNVKMMVSAV
jgi:hypothetical protein